jgi:hypothetical protein
MTESDDSGREGEEAAPGESGELPGGDEQYPPIDFNTFILSLSTSAMMNMGAVPEPESGQTELNLPLAKQTIDLIALLEEKSRGNLTGEEERLVSQVLQDLRDRYVKTYGAQHGREDG